MRFTKYISNLPGWRTKQKLINIESDDWGSLRAPSEEGYQSMKALKLPLGSNQGDYYNKYDDLASKTDLQNLFEVLHSVKDSHHNPAVITAVSLVANPDFKKIEDNHFKTYYYKTLQETLEEKNKSESWTLWSEGFQQKVFIPEFHGREHLNIAAWMRALQNNDTIAKEGFKHQFWGFRSQDKSFFRYQGAFDLQKPEDLAEQHKIIRDGLQLFEKIHQRKARFFVPPNGPINNALEKTAAEEGIQYISTPKIQKEVFGNGKTKKNFRYLGKQNKHKQYYLTRNAFFEPSSPQKNNWVDSCLADIDSAFQYHKPATISTHRVNYIGDKELKNRDNGLKSLKSLLTQILKKWPDVEFITSSELGDRIRHKKNRY